MKDLQELVVEAQRVTQIADMTDRVSTIIRNSLTFLNRNLRIQSMEAIAEVTVQESDLREGQGNIPFPDSLIEVRYLYPRHRDPVNGDTLGAELTKVSPEALYRGLKGWAIFQNSILTSLEPGTFAALFYYKGLDPKGMSFGFLLEDEPEICSAVFISKAFADDGNLESATTYAGYANSLIAALNEEDEMRRMSKTSIRRRSSW